MSRTPSRIPKGHFSSFPLLFLPGKSTSEKEQTFRIKILCPPPLSPVCAHIYTRTCQDSAAEEEEEGEEETVRHKARALPYILCRRGIRIKSGTPLPHLPSFSSGEKEGGKGGRKKRLWTYQSDYDLNYGYGLPLPGGKGEMARHGK